MKKRRDFLVYMVVETMYWFSVVMVGVGVVWLVASVIGAVK